jgi:flagellar hook-associated protein 3 FlgL
LGTQGANGTNSASNLAAIAQQVQSILSAVVAAANTSVGGTYLFGGTNTTTAPYTADSSSSTGYTYNGNSNSNSVAIGDNLNVQVNLPGSQIFSDSTSNVIGTLSSLVSALQSGNSAQISAATSSISAAIDTVSQAQGFYSNAASQLNAQETSLQQDTVTLTTQQNNLVGVDEAQAATQLSQAETANSAILAAAAKVLPNTLLNYLSTPSA